MELRESHPLPGHGAQQQDEVDGEGADGPGQLHCDGVEAVKGLIHRAEKRGRAHVGRGRLAHVGIR